MVIRKITHKEKSKCGCLGKKRNARGKKGNQKRFGRVTEVGMVERGEAIRV